ncbi:MAG: 30S ribosomal protein S6 [Candidatus Avilachnospira sp.]|jgi:small subunit ribosomal protein S6
MNKYEITVILSAKLEEEQRNEALEKIKGYITRFGGTVGEVEDWGKKKLAYDIQHQSEGFYYLINFEGTQDTPNELESRVRIMEPVLRYLVVKKEN